MSDLFMHLPVPHGEHEGFYHLMRVQYGGIQARIEENVPASRERSLALTKLEESYLWLSAALHNEGPFQND